MTWIVYETENCEAHRKVFRMIQVMVRSEVHKFLSDVLTDPSRDAKPK